MSENTTQENTIGTWYEASTGNHQGLIASETTGEDIAVVYDKKNAPLIAAAPDLLEIVEMLSMGIEIDGEIMNKAYAAIDKAKGE